MMKSRTRQRLFAGLMTVTLLLLFWFVASWVEIHPHTTDVRALTFSGSSTPVVAASSTSEIVSESPTPVRRQRPQLSKAMESKTSLLLPPQRMQASTLDIRSQRLQLTPQNRSLQIPKSEIVQRSAPTISLSAPPQKLSLVNRRQDRLETTDVTSRVEPKKMTLMTKSQPSRDTTRVLEADAAEKIVQWMQLSQSELPRGIKRHIEYQSGTVTSVASLNYEGEAVEIYLMARLPSKELHVVVVRENTTYYMVDPSFKREGRKFRVGIAHRTNGEITAVTSEEQAASNQNALHQYDVFLAWWDELNVTLQ
ncbi:MAG: hypothetical protein OXE59_02260 [Bacteroidetes bacterium]|nr:hypothetical protein [Bacteroidota bacterium]MCY4232554.1 hypothetical protein [Bacteroidota bacterium]